jgi:non-heme chloroperoxidase
MNRSTSTQGPFVKTDDGVNLFYQDWGSGPTVVLVASLGMNSDQWQYNVADLVASGHRCVAFDRRGHGRSDRPRDGYTFARLADDVAVVMDALDIRDATLVGHSLGGLEAAGYVARHGAGRLGGLALLAPTLPFLLKTADNPRGIDRSRFDAQLGMWRSDYPAWLQTGPSNVELFYRRDTFPISQGIVDWTVDMMRATSVLQVQLACAEVVAGTDLRSDLARIEVPTLVIHGDADASIPAAFGRATAELIRGSRYLEYAGAPHGLFLTHRERLHRDLCDLIDLVATPGGRRRG